MSAARVRKDYTLNSQWIDLIIRQQPEHALVTTDNKEKLRKAIDPPPIVEMKVNAVDDPGQNFLFSPYLFMNTVLIDADNNETLPGSQMIGQTSSSLHRLKDVNNKDGGFFVFGDISIRKTGNLRLKFNLFNTENDQVVYLKSIVSETFKVVTSKDFKGVAQSTHLSRTFSDQGVRLRLRKEARTMGGSSNQKRGWSSDEQTSPEVKRSRMDSQMGMNSYGSHSHMSSYGGHGQLGYGGHPTLGSNAPISSHPALGSNAPMVHTLGSNAPVSSVPRTNSTHLSTPGTIPLGSSHVLGSSIPPQQYRDGQITPQGQYGDPMSQTTPSAYYNYPSQGSNAYSYTAAPGMSNQFAESTQVGSYAGLPVTSASVDQSSWPVVPQGMNWWGGNDFQV
ncbi:Hypothetical protein R9X50_00308500 [Acrodontium crateriforme]|uniref:Velvet domain-containing protein n=1 Tax=Acrodontium crateriforme TaxID=150365 RepID=A0AAQ3R3Z5_9PEZI|nr:Hypothetical protein R9X50_00308500 [Acrodontium crateriforme]